MNAEPEKKPVEEEEAFSIELLAKDITDAVKDKPGFGGTAKFVLSDMGSVYIDGSGESIAISMKTDPADCTLTTDSDTFLKITNGDIEAVSALEDGKLTLEGDDAIAGKVGEILEDISDE